MNLEKYVVISGMSGVHKLVASRPNGLIIEDKNEGRTRFVPVRQNQFTPLATVAVYTDTEEGTIPLADVWKRIHEQYESTPPPPQTAVSAAFRAYFSTVIPEHDLDRVHINDIKKCLKWFAFALDKGVIAEAIAEGAAKEEPATEPIADTQTEEKPAEEAAA